MEKKEILSNLIYKIDNYKCVTLDLNTEQNFLYIDNNSENEQILLKIQCITEEFQILNLKAIWLIIPNKHAHLIHLFTKNEYKFHHTEEHMNLIMYKWLLNTPCNLPKYASRYMGVGGLILNNSGQILLVKEKRTISKKLDDLWKIPTGLAENGESIEQAIVREVKEETGLVIKFQGVFAFRETYPYLFNTSDLFFVCYCKCDGEQMIDFGEELKDCKWFCKDDINEIIREKKCSSFTAGMFGSIMELLPDGLINHLLMPKNDRNVMNNKFTFYSPKL
jgi:ADP-ribose pyrophosphatase YjhB (NUDIX family)